MAYFHESPTLAPQLGDYGWSCQIRRGPLRIGAEGHEIITRDAIGSGVIGFTVGGSPMSRPLSATDIADIVLGVRSVDLGVNDADDSGAGVTAAFNFSEQKRHSLRRDLSQPFTAALADIRAEFFRAHAAVLAERDPRRRMRLIGVVLHLIQDSFSPAHTERNPASGWCLSYIRNFGRGRAPREHGTPTDSRDSITAAGSTAARTQATAASRRYLQIVLKALRGVLAPDPIAAAEAAGEVGAFVADVFRRC